MCWCASHKLAGTRQECYITMVPAGSVLRLYSTSPTVACSLLPMANDSKFEDKLPPHFTKDPDATEPELVAKRREQWRHFSRDPYKIPNADGKLNEPTQEREPTGYSRLLRHPGSAWTLLFYDLAWTATFATLSQ
ncbi:hypothetical protein RSAG8_02259, partial [Rhizoctonia solani AG-8 WAC10335]